MVISPDDARNLADHWEAIADMDEKAGLTELAHMGRLHAEQLRIAFDVATAASNIHFGSEASYHHEMQTLQEEREQLRKEGHL
jgi:hypothetical protein